MNAVPNFPPRHLSRRNVLRLGGLAVAGAAAPALAGCAGGDGGGGSDGGVDMQFMYWGSSFEQKAINAMLDQFEARNKGVTVRPVYTPNEYDTKVNTLVAGNRTPDVAYMGGSMGYRLAEQGKLVNLYTYFDKYPALAKRLPGTYFWYGKDKTFGTQTANEVMLLWYNKAVLKEAGVETPPAVAEQAWKWDAFLENAYKLTRDQSGRRPDESGFDPKRIRQFGASISVQSSYSWEGFLASNGGAFVDEAGRKCLLDQPEAVELNR
jgi:multiple sugar transport system substrate-binding protein